MLVTLLERMPEPANRTDVFQRLYQAHYGAIAAYASRRLDAQEADDAVAEIFLVAWRRLADVPQGAFALPWLYGVGRRVVAGHRRSGRRRDRLIARLKQVRSPAEVSLDMAGSDDRLTVEVALSRLRPRDQELLRLAEWEELTPSELAEVLHCSANAVSVRLHRAHRRFGEALRSVEAQVEPGREKESSG